MTSSARARPIRRVKCWTAPHGARAPAVEQVVARAHTDRAEVVMAMNHWLIDNCGSGLAISAKKTERSHAIHALPDVREIRGDKDRPFTHSRCRDLPDVSDSLGVNAAA